MSDTDDDLLSVLGGGVAFCTIGWQLPLSTTDTHICEDEDELRAVVTDASWSDPTSTFPFPSHFFILN